MEILQEFVEAVDKFLTTEHEDDFENVDWLANYIVQTYPKYRGHSIRSLYKELTGKEI